MEQVISSELAARTFGQVATNQLEEVCGVALTPSPSPGGRGESIEPVATAYARHFRITGRTCSLLMLETEQDYARFNIKPEEDSFVVKERPADAIVGKAIAEAIAAMSDPKASFLAWYSRLGGVGSAFRPAGRAEGLYRRPAGGDASRRKHSRLACKLRLRSDLPENLRQPWHTGLADYDTLDAEAQRRLAACGADDALRCLSSLVEERPGDAGAAARSGIHGHRLAAAGRGVSSLAPSVARADLRAGHLPRPGPLPGADGQARIWRSSITSWPAAASGTGASATCTTSRSWTTRVFCGGWSRAKRRKPKVSLLALELRPIAAGNA